MHPMGRMGEPDEIAEAVKKKMGTPVSQGYGLTETSPLTHFNISAFSKITGCWIVPRMGNTYSGSSPTGLAAILDVADPGDKILITSFGSGAGSDSFVLRATGLLPQRRGLAPSVRSMLDGPRQYVTYGEYAKYREKIKRAH